MFEERKTFDFDAWKSLAHSDPEAFEVKRRDVVEKELSKASADTRQRLRCLQWRIDMERARSSNPMQSTLSIYDMMWDSVYGDHGLLTALKSLDGPHSHMQREIKTSDILPFGRVANKTNN